MVGSLGVGVVVDVDVYIIGLLFRGGDVVEGCGVGRWLTRERSIGTLKNSIVFNILFF